MRIAVTGASGLIGRDLVRDLLGHGHEVSRLVRVRSSPNSAPPADGIFWDPERGEIDAASLEGHDAVIHLAGESVSGLWTKSKKRRIRESRIRGTMLLARTLAGLSRPPCVLLSASAIGYYGDRALREPLGENSAPGKGFLADTVVAWEAATNPAASAGIRVVRLRFGIVLAAAGGALAAMLPAFRLGLGGRIGSGEQIMSWVALAEIPHIIRHVLDTPGLTGPVNVVAPHPLSNAEFTETLGRVLQRPTLLAVPALPLRLLLGEMAEEVLLGGARVVPEKLRETGYGFRWPDLGPALEHALGI